MTQPVFTWQVLARRGWMLVLGLVFGLAIGAAVGGISVSAGSSFAVKQQAAHPTPYQDGRLALTYARLLPEDRGVVEAVADATGLSRDDVRGNLRMSAEPNTNIVFVRFSSDDLGTSLSAVRAFGDAVRTQTDPTGTPLRESMQPVSLPNSGIGFSRKKAILLGGAAGLLIAFALALACESRLPRVDDLERLGGILPVPVSRVSWRSLPAALQSAAERGGPGQLALTAVGNGRFAERAGAVAAQAGGSAAGGRRALLIRRGAPVAEVEDAWSGCLAAGSVVDSAFLVHGGLPLRLRGREMEVGHAPG
jgi:hypothetical protein